MKEQPEVGLHVVRTLEPNSGKTEETCGACHLAMQATLVGFTDRVHWMMQ